MSAWQIEYLDGPGSTPPRLPFRCASCGRMQHECGEWVHRWDGVPGHFMAICGEGVGHRAPRRKRWRLFGVGRA